MLHDNPTFYGYKRYTSKWPLFSCYLDPLHIWVNSCLLSNDDDVLCANIIIFYLQKGSTMNEWTIRK